MKRLILYLAALAAGVGWAADELPTYSLTYPPVTPIFVNTPTNSVTSDWLAANAFHVAMSACATNVADSITNTTIKSDRAYRLESAEIGFPWQRVKPEYYLADRINAPDDVDWRATAERYEDDMKAGKADAGAFLFNVTETDPCVYAADGGNHSLTWVMKDGREEQMIYTVGSVCQGRPRRIFWTDYPYNGQKISLQGKFVRFFGSAALVNPATGTVTNVVGGVVMVQENVVTQGLYLDTSSMTLEARGQLTGQVLMAYYASGSYDSILCVQVVEICEAKPNVLSATVGAEVKPIAKGYSGEGLSARVSAGVGDSLDEFGDYLYQHAGQHSYSPKNGAVFAIRPTMNMESGINEYWKAEVTWMETDPMNVQWPFEIDRYLIDWPGNIRRFVRGDKVGDFGANIVITNVYTTELQKYQYPNGHALEVGADGVFSTEGEGKALLKLTGDDNVWFLPVESIMRTNRTYYTLTPSRVNVGAELELRSGTRSGVAPGVQFNATSEIPGYIYRPGTPGGNYDVNLYSETNSASAIYAVSTGGDIEVWWSERFQAPDMPAPIAIPVLPQIYRPVWPAPDEAPQIVIASREGSANEMAYARYGAAYFDAANASMTMPWREYFNGDAGTVMFWTRSAHYNDVMAVTNAPGRLITVTNETYGTITAEIANDGNGPLVRARVGNTSAELPLPKDDAPNAWHHVAIAFGGESAPTLHLDGAAGARKEFATVEAVAADAPADEPLANAIEPSEGDVDLPTGDRVAYNGETELAAGVCYEVTGVLTNSTIYVKGTPESPTSLILADGAALTVNGGIRVLSGNALNIYAQSSDTKTMGRLIAKSGDYSAGIGGEYGKDGGEITIYGGMVTATGGFAAAGIGGGCYGAGGKCVISNGVVTATGGNEGAGIGGGYQRTGGEITIYGGCVTALASGGSYASGAGIGGGSAYKNEGCPGGTITIYGGAVTATGNSSGAGIGGGYAGSGGVITIFGGRVTATGGWNAAGIGGGKHNIKTNGAGTILISGGTVDATGQGYGMDIGLGSGGNGGTATITGGSVLATRSNVNPRLRNKANLSVYCVTVELDNDGINDKRVEVAGLDRYGVKDVYPIDGKVYLWLPDGNYLFAIDRYQCFANVDGKAVVAQPTALPVSGNSIGAFGPYLTAVGREMAEVTFFTRRLTPGEIEAERYALHSGEEIGISGYFSFRSGEDLDVEFQQADADIRRFYDRVTGEKTCIAVNTAYVSPGAPAKGGVVIQSDETPTIYYQNDPKAAGYNPNDEHALVRAGSGGYVVWALRSDLATEDTPPAVFAEYKANGKNRLQFFHVVATNETWPVLGYKCEAGKMLPGPHPLDYFDNPWLKEDYWEPRSDESGNKLPGFAYRDRKGQIWARAAGELKIHMFYAMQEGFYFPSLGANAQPAVGKPIPWLARHEKPNADVLTGNPATWTWEIAWPKNVNTMKIGQTLTTAVDDLPEVWNAKSVSVVYPVGGGEGFKGDVDGDQVPVMLSDPTVMSKEYLSEADFKKTGLSIDANGGLTYKGGKYHFTELPPSLSSRLYYDNTTQNLCFIGERVEKNAGATILYPNVLSAAERTAILGLVKTNAEGYRAWTNAVNKLALAPVQPNTMATSSETDEIVTTYRPVDHYALTALGPTNYVVIIENDASDEHMSKDDFGKINACPVADGDAISMHVFLVTNLYYTGRIVTREDEVNLLSQQLSVLYTDPIGGKADDFEFEWKSASPNPDGTIPDNYERLYQPRPVSELCGETVGSSPTVGKGLTRFVIGQQGDTLANMVNKYWICRYRAVEGTPAYSVMSNRWSAWCAPPALAEGWVQRVLNNVTPFNQRMTDLYENKAETAVSMIQQAGGPFTGDVALNQDNLTNIGLIQLYETLLNKAESMSLLLKINDAGANKQLQLAVERLGDLYKVLGDEAYSDAKNPTIGFGEKMELMDQVEFASEASSLFCFDNQVNSLLDEELCLLRGRSGVSAPTTRMGPYYNRLLWNFTKGITAGEVAYAVNYNVSGTETVALSEEQAARVYPQGHGDAYGHYLSALKGWYRLLRNPYFSWGRPAQGEMNVADSAVNVDYYEEAKFAEAAADLAKTAADVVDLSARKAWRDNGKDGSGYLDSNPTNAFGYGEWATRGGYGALVNWVTANSILPEDCNLEAARTESEPYHDTAYQDKGLMRIDRGTVDELADICENASRIQQALDRLDAGLNPLGLSDHAIPFDISPIGASDGSNTHFEQVRDRAKTALANARKVLERAQTQASRMRMVSETAENYANTIASQEEDYDNQLIGYYGTPYSDDIGPGKTYKQGYAGPDLIHYMWMDLSKYVMDEKDGSTVGTLEVKLYNDASGADIAEKTSYDSIRSYIHNHLNYDDPDLTLTFEVARCGFIRKPDNITGYRAAPGTIQQKYADMLLAYYGVTSAKSGFEKAHEQYIVTRDYTSAVFALQTTLSAANEAYLVVKTIADKTEAYLKMALATLDWEGQVADVTRKAVRDALPDTVGAGMTVITSPSSLLRGATAEVDALGQTTVILGKQTIQRGLLANELLLKEFDSAVKALEIAFSYTKEYFALTEQFKSAAMDLNSAYWDIVDAVQKLEVAADAVNKEIGDAEAVLAKREQARKRQVDQLSQLRYNEMLFRKIRDKSLTRYSAAFDLAQKYVYMAAQAYDYETALKREDEGSGEAFISKIVSTRALGAFDSDGEPMVADDGDLGLSGYLAQMDANWQVMKPRLGINNPQPYTTWFSLRGEKFRILDGETGDQAWAKELEKHWVDDITRDPEFKRYCQPFVSQFGLRDKEPGLIIPFETTIDFAKNLFGNDLAGGDHAYDSSWYSTRIAAAGVWFDGYNAKTADAVSSAKPQLAETPVVYLVPVGYDCLRAPGLADGTYWRYSVVDQVIAAPYNIGSYELDSDMWMPSMNDADWEGQDATVKIRKHPSFRAYFNAAGGEPTDDRLDATRLIGRSVWNTRWLLVIPAGSMNADREKALSVFINGSDTNRDGKLDLKPVSDIKIGFRTYSQSGN